MASSIKHHALQSSAEKADTAAHALLLAASHEGTTPRNRLQWQQFAHAVMKECGCSEPVVAAAVQRIQHELIHTATKLGVDPRHLHQEG